MRWSVACLLAGLFVGLTGCGDGGVDIAMDARSDEGEVAAAEARLPPVDSLADGAPDPEASQQTGDVAIEVAEQIGPSCDGPGCFKDPCEQNEDCLSGLCVQHLGDGVCSDFCVEECPDGWTCKQMDLGGSDPVFACLSNHSHLCLPCGESSDCCTAYVKNACVVYQGQGTFCGASCDGGAPCPDGYLCQQALNTEGGSSMQCLAVAGVCECSKTASKMGMGTPCVVENDIGECWGKRQCTEGGLTDCDAAAPAPDLCNGLDDDCDGDADAGSCEDSNPCTDDLCQPETGCEHAPLSGFPCDDADDCTSGDTCSQGKCAGVPVKCNDGNPCTDDLCDGASGCAFPPNFEPCDDGDPCTLSDHCQEGACVPGPTIQCDDGNPCTDDACDAAQGCLFKNNAKACDDGNPCTTGDLCTAGKCVWGGLLDCDDGNLCTTDACDPTDGCSHLPNSLPCDDSNVCTTGDKCQSAACLPGKAANCDDSNVCTDDSCNPLVGCMHVNNAAACDDLDPCTATDQCTGGACVGTGSVLCDDQNPCTDDFCVPMGGCSHKQNQAPCSDDDVCTVGDKCVAGICSSGPPLVCQDGNVCTWDSCEAKKGCVFAPATGQCDDHNDCTTDDHCDKAACVSSQVVDCDDKNPCTTDVCLPDGGCAATPNKAPCDDSDLCTVGDTCSAGKCKAGFPVQCNDSNPCTKDSCVGGSCQFSPAAGDCDDGNPCTKGDACKNGFCAGTLPADCDDQNGCTTDWCDPAKGCLHQVNTAPCDDGNLCTTKDQCDSGACKGTGPLACSDGNPCTDDACDPKQGCTFVPNAVPCDDKNACTTGDQCAAGFCGAPAALDCDDGNPCTKDGCEPAGGCKHVPVAGPCSDGSACTFQDQCEAGKCVPGGPLPCDDSDPCTTDTCEPAAGCVHAPGNDGAICDDANVCTKTDKCSGGKCMGAEPATCVDGNVCTDDDCDPKTGCSFPALPDGLPCDDGSKCTQTDTCAAGKCVGASPLSCSDGKPCTTDSCDAAQGCVFAPIAPCCGNGVKEGGEDCDDGNVSPGDGCSANCKNESDPVCASNYKTLNDSVRNVGYTGSVGCDSGLATDWYRLQPPAGIKMPNSPPGEYHCGTHAPGWINGSDPSPSDGIVNRQVCYQWVGQTCWMSNTIQVVNCGSFYLYKLPPTPGCSLRYCGTN